MRPTQVRLTGHYDPKHNIYQGWWGAMSNTKQKGITTYSLSSNRQNLNAHVLQDAIFNTWRRSKNQIGYWLPPFAIAYLIMDWAIKKNEYLNSKPGRLEAARLEEAAANK